MPYLYPTELLGLHDNAAVELDIRLSNEFLDKMFIVWSTERINNKYNLVLSRIDAILDKVNSIFSN